MLLKLIKAYQDEAKFEPVKAMTGEIHALGNANYFEKIPHLIMFVQHEMLPVILL